MNDKVTQLQNAIQALDTKDFNMYFFVLDTMGNPTAGIANIYEHVKILNDLGYKAHIMHEKQDYKGVASWLGEEYANLPHVAIEGQNLNIAPADFIFIPEIFSNIMDQVKGFPCKKVVFSQNYNYILELLPIGKRWNFDYGFNDVITTSEKQATYLKSLFPNINTHVVPVSIPKYFKPTDKLKEPVINIVTREQSDALKIVKSFYLQYPMYKWVTFKELRGLPRKTFAEELGKACLAVWVDDVAGFGTFPLEAIQSGTPVIGKIPNMMPEWMEDVTENGVSIKNNGIWTDNILNLPELIATYMKLWFEDSVPEVLADGIEASKDKYTEEIQVSKVSEIYSNLIGNRRVEFETILKSQEENKAEDEQK